MPSTIHPLKRRNRSTRIAFSSVLFGGLVTVGLSVAACYARNTLELAFCVFLLVAALLGIANASASLLLREEASPGPASPHRAREGRESTGQSRILERLLRSTGGADRITSEPSFEPLLLLGETVLDAQTEASVFAALENALKSSLPDLEWAVVPAETIETGRPSHSGLDAARLRAAWTGEVEHRESPQATVAPGPKPVIVGAHCVFVLSDGVRKFAAVVARVHASREPFYAKGALLMMLATAALGRIRTGGASVSAQALELTRTFAQGVANELSPSLQPSEMERVAAVVDCLRMFVGRTLQSADEHVDLAAVAAVVLEQLRKSQPSAVLILTAPQPVWVRHHVAALRDVIETMIHNALRVGQADHVREGTVQVVVRVRSDGSNAIVEVEDNGPGLTLPARRQLFRRFFPLVDARSALRGLGFGRWLVQAYGGDLVLAATGPSGTACTLTLPATEGPSPLAVFDDAPTLERPVDVESAPRPPILVVDDEAVLLRSMKRWLSRDAQVTTTLDPREALTLAANNPYALVLCDLNMPTMTGPQFVQALRTTSPAMAARVVIMTGSIDEQVPGVTVVTKPLQPSMIKQLLREVGPPTDSEPAASISPEAPAPERET